MWQVLRSADNLTGWPPGKALEYLVLRAFQLEGAEVTWPYEVRRRNVVVEQVDGAVYFDGLTCLIEAKDHAEPMDFLPIFQMKARLQRRPRTVMGAVFSASGFTEPALQMAELLPPPDVLLWDEQDLEWALHRGSMREGMQLKLRYAIECGFADFELVRKKGTRP